MDSRAAFVSSPPLFPTFSPVAKDVARYSMADAALSSGGGLDALERAAAAGEGGGGGGGEESGWKLVHGDVFRPPPHAPLLAALLGAGAQLAAVTVATAGATIAGALFAGRGSIGGVALACWALSSFPAGYVSGAFVARSGGRAWIPTYALTAGLLPGCAALAGAGLNVLSLLYGATAFPFSAVAKLLLLWLLVACPLALAGTLVGRHAGGAGAAGGAPPCRVRSIPRPVPPAPWYAQPAFLIPAGGALPFGARTRRGGKRKSGTEHRAGGGSWLSSPSVPLRPSPCAPAGAIFIELHFLFLSFWGGKVYFLCAQPQPQPPPRPPAAPLRVRPLPRDPLTLPLHPFPLPVPFPHKSHNPTHKCQLRLLPARVRHAARRHRVLRLGVHLRAAERGEPPVAVRSRRGRAGAAARVF